MLKKLTLLSLCTPLMVWADNAATVLELPKIDAVSTTPVQGLATPLNQVPGNVQSISAKTIDDQHIVDFTEALNSNLGSVNLNDTQSSPMQMDVSFRGFTASPILGTPQGLSVFVDGVRVNESFGDVVNWDLIPKNAISNITIMPGSNPVFGLNTLGGAISVGTKSGFDFPGTTITAIDGRWNRRTLNFETGGHGENADYFLATSFMDDNGWGAHNPAIVRQLFGKVGWQNDQTDVDFSVQLADNHFNGNQSVPLQMMGNPSMPYTWPDFESNRLAGFNLKGTQFLTNNWLLAGNLYLRQVVTSVFNSNVSNNSAAANPSNTPTTSSCAGYNQVDSSNANWNLDGACNVLSTVNQQRSGGALQLTSISPLWELQNTFTFGLAYDHGISKFQEGLQSAVIAADRSSYSSEPIYPYVNIIGYTNTESVYATNTLGITNKTFLTLSGRYDRTLVKVDDQYGLQLNQNNNFNRFNPAAGMTYNPTSALTTYVNYSQGMRAPTPVELACASPTDPCALPNAFNSDPVLKPVTSSSWEVGGRGQLAKGFSWNAALFNTVLNNDIEYLPAPSSSTSGYFSNVGQTQRRGLEMGLSGDFGKIRWLTNYTFMDARFQSSFAESNNNNSNQANAVQPGNRIPGVPQHTLKVRLEYLPMDTLKVGVTMLAQTYQYPRGNENNQDALGTIPGFAVFGLDARYRFASNWELFGKVDNLFNRTYSTFGQLGHNMFIPGNYSNGVFSGAGTPTQFRTVSPPIGAWMGVTWHFGGDGKKQANQDND